MALRIYSTTRSPSLTDTLTVDGAAFDLSGHTVKFQMRAVGSSTLKVDTAATIVSAAAGTVRYDWAAADVDTPGDHIGWWRVTLSNGKIQDHPEFLIDVQAHAQAAAHLCEIADVREYLQKPVGDRAQDSIIESLIARASELIAGYTGREFLPNGTVGSPVARLFDVNGYARTRTVPVGDLSAVPSAASLLDAYGTTVSTLTPASDFVALPLNRLSHHPIRSLRVRPPIVLDPSYQLSLTGVWGFPSIPADVRQACILTVGIWVRRDIQAFTSTFNLTEDRVERPETVPSGVRGLLSHYREPPIA